MSDADKDVLGKADALLRRHSATGEDTGSVPVLTDLVDAAEPAASEPATEADPRLAQEVLERVMAQVEGRLAAQLEQRVARDLSDQVHAAVAAALEGMRDDLGALVRDAVAEALEARRVK
jgi:hypothetical protein